MISRLTNVLLVAVPLALAAWYLNRNGSLAGTLTFWIFLFALVALIPLANLLGGLTDRVNTFTSQRAGGLIGASFGNVPELAIGLFLLIQAAQNLHSPHMDTFTNDFDVLRGLVIGSVINNVLFVFGSSTFLGALRHGRLKFDRDTAASNASMLALAVVGLALPTLATKLSQASGTEVSQGVQIEVSVLFAVILIVSYAAYIATSVFNVGAHGSAAADEEGDEAEAGETEEAGAGDRERAMRRASAEAEAARRERERQAKDAKARERRRLRRGEFALALVGLSLATLVTVFMAGLLVSITDAVIVKTSLTPLSVGLILFPIVCNLGEQATALNATWRRDMNEALEVASGSSVQVPLLVTPVLMLLSLVVSLVFAGGSADAAFALIFRPLELVVLGLVCFVFALVSLDGEVTWLEGLQLLAFYAMVVAVSFALPGA